MSNPQARIALVLFAACACACTTGGKAKLMRTALDERSSRSEWFEATLRVLDENPEYVDEFYGLAKKHPSTLDRFIRKASHDMDEPALAKATARYLAEDPRALREVLIRTLEQAETHKSARDAIATASADRPSTANKIAREHPDLLEQQMVRTLEIARDSQPTAGAINRALADKVALSADLITDDPKLVEAMMLATIEKVQQKPAARAAFVRAMYAASPALARLLAQNPKLLSEMMVEIAKQAGRDPKLVKDVLGNILSPKRK